MSAFSFPYPALPFSLVGNSIFQLDGRHFNAAAGQDDLVNEHVVLLGPALALEKYIDAKVLFLLIFPIFLGILTPLSAVIGHEPRLFDCVLTRWVHVYWPNLICVFLR